MKSHLWSTHGEPKSAYSAKKGLGIMLVSGQGYSSLGSQEKKSATKDQLYDMDLAKKKVAVVEEATESDTDSVASEQFGDNAVLQNWFAKAKLVDESLSSFFTTCEKQEMIEPAIKSIGNKVLKEKPSAMLLATVMQQDKGKQVVAKLSDSLSANLVKKAVATGKFCTSKVVLGVKVCAY